jgi:hypothetical protein
MIPCLILRYAVDGCNGVSLPPKYRQTKPISFRSSSSDAFIRLASFKCANLRGFDTSGEMAKLNQPCRLSPARHHKSGGAHPASPPFVGLRLRIRSATVLTSASILRREMTALAQAMAPKRGFLLQTSCAAALHCAWFANA